jgi:hypothetical protein
MAERGEEQRDRGFKVQDRRRFADAESGERATELDDAAASQHGAEHVEAGASQRPVEGREGAANKEPADAGAHGDAGARGEARLAEMTFSTFVMGLTTQALMHLGEIADPVEQQVGRDLPAAKQMIDLLAILNDKTKGNLDAGEEQLLKSMLYDLRMRYVEAARAR